MTSTAGFPSLQAPAHEDTMEMSSPAGRTYDDDIDIDPIDFGPDVDDEHMIEDDEQTAALPTGDDMMEDDAQPLEPAVQEQEMQDDFDPVTYEQRDPDDELIDYGEDENEDPSQFHDQNFANDTVPDVEIFDQQPEEADFEQADEEIVREREVLEAQQAPAVVEETIVPLEDTVSAPEALPQPAIGAGTNGFRDDRGFAGGEGLVQPNAPADEVVAIDGEATTSTLNPGPQAPAADEDEEPDDTFRKSTGDPAPANSTENPSHGAPVATRKPTIQVPPKLAPSASFDVDAPGTPTDTGLHPVTVNWNGWEWPLFRSRQQPEGLLKDDNLASVGLAELLANCRQRISIKTGEMISEDQEATLSFDSLGMEVSENHPACFSTSLSEVLDVYKELCTNDGLDEVPALDLTLSFNVKFASRLAGLKDAASAGVGLYQCNPEYLPEDYGEGDADYDQGEHGDSTGFEENTAAGTREEAQQVSAPQEDSNNSDEITYDDQPETDQPKAGHEDTVDQALGYVDDHDEPAGNVAALQGNDSSASAKGPDGTTREASRVDADQQVGEENTRPESPPAPSPDLNGESDHAANDQATDEGEVNGDQEVATAASGASSTTLRADEANTADGESPNEDLIDYDELCLTSDSSELGPDEHGDFSAFFDDFHNGEPEGQADGHAVTEEHAAEAHSALGDGYEASQDISDHVHDTAAGQDVTASEDQHNQSFANGIGEHFYEQDAFNEGLFDEGQGYEYADQGNAHEDGNQHQGDDTDPGQDQAERTDNSAHPEAALDTTGTSLEFGLQQQTRGESASVEGSGNNGNTEAQPDASSKGTPDADDEDSIDFDDDTTEEHEARKAAEQLNATKTSGSPLGKRSFDETEAPNEDEEPDLKKARSS